MNNVVTRFETDFSFFKKKSALPSVEIDLQSLEAAGINSYIDEVCTALHGYIHTASPITIYSLETPSLNFGDAGYSVFIGVGASEAVLKSVYHHFSKIINLKVRYSEYIPVEAAVKAIHVEFENIWMPHEEETWYSVISASQLKIDTTTEDDLWSDEVEDVEWDEFEIDGDVSEVKKATRPLRMRAARKDASVGTVRKTIESIFGLPKGSVQLCGPDRVALRSDARIGTLRKRWKDQS